MFPAGDEAESHTHPIVTYMLIGINVGVFFLEYSDPWTYELMILRYGFIPRLLTINPLDGFLRMLTSMFLHADIMHIFGNMVFLYIFGDNVEDRMGHVKFLIFYIIFGIVASLAHFMIDPTSKIPAIGASGAISGVMGAYMVMFPFSRVRVFYRFFMVRLPAVVYLGFWFLLQLLESMLPDYTGIAYWAHIGGFLAGVVVAPFFRKKRRRQTIVQYYYYY
ncbi:MAG: rhomboid family intramembrane serine protease [Crenarchaeota archaeon]|nr:rhomboid family intramembrane serine protease [Thermoproteota archaeon]MDW8033648.1 rhomboid family intramembrane serine protease [Nitrososphaerota archaeon]